MEYGLGFFYETDVNEAGCGYCIWCKGDNPLNKAHILSKKIIKNNHQKNYLKKSVCLKCNTYINNYCEDWIYKYTPVATLAEKIAKKFDYPKHYKFLVYYVYYESLKEWMLFNYDSNKLDKLFFSQYILGSDGFFKYHGGSFSPTDKSEVEAAKNSFNTDYDYCRDKIIQSEYEEYVSKYFPEDFNPRIIIYKGSVFIVARNKEGVDSLIQKISPKQSDDSAKFEEISFSTRDVSKTQMHYKWSYQKYYAFCTKLAFEFLALFEGSQFCLNSDFDIIRHSFSKSLVEDEFTVLYDEQKGSSHALIPNGWVVNEGVDINDKDEKIPALGFLKSMSHDVIIYAYNGYLLATVKLFNLPLSQIILCKTDLELKNNYAIRYEIEAGILRFLEMGDIPQTLKGKNDKEVLESLDKDVAVFAFHDSMFGNSIKTEL